MLLITLSSIFFLSDFALSSISLGSDKQTIGVLILLQRLEAHIWIIKSGPIPDGSPGE
jgi:hypothetical protein